jgi:trehalose-phosphatase
VTRSIWIFDFDGTLSPIVAGRYAARLHPACRELLKKLSRDHENHVAVLSSRRLEDLTPRIDIPGLYLGGYNGLKWLSPEGRVLDHGHDFPGDLQQTRDVMLPGIMALNELPGMDIEDKHWAVTLHLRHLSSDLKEEVSQRILGWETGDRVRLLKGPEAWEIVFSPTFDKSVGVWILCRILGFDPHLERLIYTGDDENDALAMAYVTSQGGINITIGRAPWFPAPTSSKIRKPSPPSVVNCWHPSLPKTRRRVTHEHNQIYVHRLDSTIGWPTSELRTDSGFVIRIHLGDVNGRIPA